MFRSWLVDSRSEHGAARVRIPAVDLLDRDGESILRAELPGVPRDAVSVRVENRILTVEGGSSPLFRRRFRLSERIDLQRIVAEYRDGLLEVRLPLSERVRPRKITVQAA